MTDLPARLSGLAPLDPAPGGGTFAPRSVDELAGLMRAFRQEGAAVALRGRGAGPWWMRHDPAPPWTIRMEGIAGDPEISPIDLVMTVDAGLGLARARDAARGAGLDLLLEEPPSGPCTIGGLLARGEGRGSHLAPAGPRAVVLGIDAILPDGRLVRCGGRVVKNVAGYDTHRLFVGSLGTFGAIARVHMKLVPRPGVEMWHKADTTLGVALERAEAILRRAPQVGSLVIDGTLGGHVREAPARVGVDHRPASLRVRLSGSRRRVEILRDRLSAQLAGSGEEESDERRPIFEDQLPDQSSLARRSPDSDDLGGSASDSGEEAKRLALVRVTARPGEIPALLTRWDAALLAGSSEARVRIHPGGGGVWLLFESSASSGICGAIAGASRPNGSFLALWREPGVDGPLWDPVPVMLPFWIALRARLDPHSLWNPGVLPGGAVR